MPHRYLRLLDAAAQTTDQVAALIEKHRGRLLHVRQLRKATESVGANISEGFGRGTGPDRARILRIARGEAEEAIFHLDANFRSRRISPKEYWALYNRLVVIVKMLNSLIP